MTKIIQISELRKAPASDKIKITNKNLKALKEILDEIACEQGSYQSGFIAGMLRGGFHPRLVAILAKIRKQRRR